MDRRSIGRRPIISGFAPRGQICCWPRTQTKDVALSKIWAAFIIVSIVVAGVRYAFLPADKEIFGQMVTGKAGDTVAVGHAPKTEGRQRSDGVAGATVIAVPGTSAAGAGARPSYTVQRADGFGRIAVCHRGTIMRRGALSRRRAPPAPRLTARRAPAG